MSIPSLLQWAGVRVAVEGCGHGVLHSIYASVAKACEQANWPGVDLLIIGGDFQAVRNADDLACVSIPPRYRDMQDFHEYYAGTRKAPYLTIFVGGNHESSNYLFELHYGGWVAPNIYYMGAANVLRVGPLRIAGMSGIWKGYDYKKPHHERLPYNDDDVKSAYHTREVDVRKLLSLRTQVDVGISHDWPRAIEWQGDHKSLFRRKKHLEEDARNGTLGNVAARYVLDRLRPRYWFSAHLHVKFSAVVHHGADNEHESSSNGARIQPSTTNGQVPVGKTDEIDLGLDNEAPPSNADEIDLGLDDDEEQTKEVPVGMNGAPEPIAEDANVNESSEISEHLRSQLPAAFAKPTIEPRGPPMPFPEDITNKKTDFLALDKCLPNHDFLQLLPISSVESSSGDHVRPFQLEYDPEWLAITRVFASELVVGDATAQAPPHLGESHYLPLITAEREWIERHVCKSGKLTVPINFEMTAPAYDATRGIAQVMMPKEYPNNQTKAFCDLLEIPNPFDIAEEELEQRRQRGPRPSTQRSDRDGGARRGGHRGRGGRGGRGGRRW